jgi:hypothetical protein
MLIALSGGLLLAGPAIAAAKLPAVADGLLWVDKATSGG